MKTRQSDKDDKQRKRDVKADAKKKAAQLAKRKEDLKKLIKAEPKKASKS
jgi:hypothetical protein